MNGVIWYFMDLNHPPCPRQKWGTLRGLLQLLDVAIYISLNTLAFEVLDVSVLPGICSLSLVLPPVLLGDQKGQN